MNLEEFRKIKEYKSLGLSQKKVMEVTGLKEYDVRRCWYIGEDEFRDSMDDIGSTIEMYKDYIMEIIKTTPTIPDTNIYYKILEDFPDCNVGESTFRKYMKKLRKETGYDRFRVRSTSIRETAEPGEEAQIDFGQYKIKDMYGKKRLVYFFVMVLRYSQLKYVYFSTKDFNALTAIEAHKNAFKFFGGVPKVLVYDQDKVFAISENYGNLILVKDFENFLKEYNLSIVMCSGFYPEGKGTVENYVKIVKENFLFGRTYAGIDSLNSACLEWLDNTENNHILAHKGVTPHSLFKEESKYLKKIAPLVYKSDKPLFKVTSNYIKYRYSRYEVPIGYNGMEVKVECDGVNVVIKDKDTDALLCVHPISTKKDERMTLKDDYDVDGVGEYVVKHYFAQCKSLIKFLDNIKSRNNRYYRKSCQKLKAMISIYTKEEMIDGFDYVSNNNLHTIADYCSYMLYKYGEEKGKQAITKTKYAYYKKKAEDLKKEFEKL